jgi:hypothetical protein
MTRDGVDSPRRPGSGPGEASILRRRSPSLPGEVADSYETLVYFPGRTGDIPAEARDHRGRTRFSADAPLLPAQKRADPRIEPLEEGLKRVPSRSGRLEEPLRRVASVAARVEEALKRAATAARRLEEALNRPQQGSGPVVGHFEASCCTKIAGPSATRVEWR